MNYYVEYFYHCWRVVFNHFRDPYCPKWDTFLQEMMENYDKVDIAKRDITHAVYTVDFHYKGKVYEVWVCNGFCTVGHLHRFNGVNTSDNNQKRPSFKLQFKLVQMVIDHENNWK